MTDNWEGFHHCTPEDQLFTGKDLTFPVEQDNSNMRHYLVRFRRRTKVVSKSPHMIDLSLRLHHYLRELFLTPDLDKDGNKVVIPSRWGRYRVGKKA